MAQFAKVIFHDTEEVWDEQFRKMGKHVQEADARPVHRPGRTRPAASADAAVGPFYCPGHSRVYIDLSFYKDWSRSSGRPASSPGPTSWPTRSGITSSGCSGTRPAWTRPGGPGQAEANQMSVRLELQADYLAGVWAHHARKKYPNMLEKGDLESATNAAFHIGDDVLQKQAGRRVTPDSFTHGSARQRQRWFLEGFNSGSVKGAARLFDLPYNEL